MAQLPKRGPKKGGVVRVAITPSDFDIPAVLMDTDGCLTVQIPEEVRDVVRAMCNARVEGRCSIIVTVVATDKA